MFGSQITANSIVSHDGKRHNDLVEVKKLFAILNLVYHVNAASSLDCLVHFYFLNKC